MLQSCPGLPNLSGLQRLKFKLDGVSNVRVGGLPLSGKSAISDFSVVDGLALANNFRQNRLPMTLTLNVAAINPNDGKSGMRSSSSTMTSFDWRLLIDDVPTISGNVEKPIVIPGTGQQEIIPLSISLDLYEFFGKKGYDQIMGLALAIGGGSGSAARLKLDARPTISTAFGPMTYPGRITIIDKEFRN